MSRLDVEPPSDAPRPRRGGAAILGKLLLAGGGLLVALAVAECGVRVLLAAQRQANSLERLQDLRRQGQRPPVRSDHPLAAIIQPSANPALIYELQPNLRMDFGHHGLRINAQGLRSDRDYPLARRPRSVRIVGLGDSGMFGWDVENNQNYLAVLEATLNRRGDGVTYEALNFAVPGYNTRLEVECLKAKALAYRPDIVIVGWCENDFGLPFFLLQKENFKRRDVSFLYRMLFDRAKLEDATAPVQFRDRRTFNKNQLLPEVVAGVDVAGVRQALRELKDLGRQHQFRVLIFGPFGRLIRGLCQEEGLETLDTVERIPKDRYPKEYLVHFMHPRAEGHRVLGELLAQELQARGWLTPRP